MISYTEANGEQLCPMLPLNIRTANLIPQESFYEWEAIQMLINSK